MSPLERLLAEEWPDGTFGAMRPRYAPPTRSVCGWCGHDRALNADGTLRAHRIGRSLERQPCPGSGRRPRTHQIDAARHRAELLADLRTRKAASDLCG